MPPHLLAVHHQQRDAEQQRPEPLDGLLELARRGELVARLQPLDEGGELAAHGGHGVLRGGLHWVAEGIATEGGNGGQALEEKEMLILVGVRIFG